ncbi:MAG: pyruvate dehydrogenase (acetyl-transferring) E1 component subunit alpha, partial [Acetobacteraceae bacterium]|nr:pyruvate dehydrogenase (acetyl-transferring) E1 component subunit alpha [Acetobacteraceae bacterium]
DEVNRMRQEHDCIESAKAKLLGMGADEAELKAIEDDVRRRIADAAEFAQSSPEPDPKELWTDVLVEG